MSVSTKNLTKIEQRIGFSKSDILKIQDHVEKTGLITLSPMAAEKIFESYLGGKSLSEVCAVYSEYTPSIIYFTAYHYNWPALRDDMVLDIQLRVKQKVLYSKYQQLELVSTMIQVAHVESMQAMTLYLKNPSDRNIPKTLRIKTIKDLSMAIEMMSSIIGQDQHKSISVMGTILTKDENESGKTPGIQGSLTESTAKELLKSMNSKHKLAQVVEAQIVESIYDKAKK